ncbi:MAG TPA: S-layer homology domain-containing protein [Clostridia bacterium]|nr:S-layer homology domain-containing protein [Clostridia bacterium]
MTSGGSQTFTITPDNNYGISSVTVDGVNQGTIATYTFSNVSGNHTISVTFTYTGGSPGGSSPGGGSSTTKYTLPANKSPEDEAWVNPYSDVPGSTWYYASVCYISRKGLMNGDGGHFDPDGDMTRAMAVTVLFRLGGDSGSYKNTFSDVDSGAWYGQAVAWASANGITSGVGGNRFAPKSPLSREQLAVMLYNYAKSKGLTVTVTGNDVLDGYSDAGSVSAWAKDAMIWAVSLGIISGDGVNLDPQDNTTRAQIAAMLQRFIEYVGR